MCKEHLVTQPAGGSGSAARAPWPRTVRTRKSESEKSEPRGPTRGSTAHRSSRAVSTSFRGRARFVSRRGGPAIARVCCRGAATAIADNHRRRAGRRSRGTGRWRPARRAAVIEPLRAIEALTPVLDKGGRRIAATESGAGEGGRLSATMSVTHCATQRSRALQSRRASVAPAPPI